MAKSKQAKAAKRAAIDNLQTMRSTQTYTGKARRMTTDKNGLIIFI